MNTMSLKKMVVVIALVCISAGYVWADGLRLQERLSKDVRIQLRDVTIVEALEKIGQKAGVKFILSDESVWKLPQGEATRLSVALDGPLADSMTEMLNAFFMRYAVADEEITIYPRPELEHILGRPTAKQLELLARIYKGNFTVSGQVDSRTTINKILGQEVLILPVHRYSELSKFMSELGRGLPEGERSPPFTLAQMLDSGERAWYLSGPGFPGQIPEIQVVSVEEFQEAKLNQVVDISFKDEMAEVILRRLAGWTGMELLVLKKDNKWLWEEITVDMQNVKLRQAILNIVGTMDGGTHFDLTDNEISIAGPRTARTTTARRTARSSSDDYVGKISIPMDSGRYFIEFMLREKDLTEELKKLRSEKMKEVLGRLPEQEKSKKDSE